MNPVIEKQSTPFSAEDKRAKRREEILQEGREEHAETMRLREVFKELQERESEPPRTGGLRMPHGVCFHDWQDVGLYLFNAKHEHQPVEQCSHCGLLHVSTKE